MQKNVRSRPWIRSCVGSAWVRVRRWRGGTCTATDEWRESWQQAKWRSSFELFSFILPQYPVTSSSLGLGWSWIMKVGHHILVLASIRNSLWWVRKFTPIACGLFQFHSSGLKWFSTTLVKSCGTCRPVFREQIKKNQIWSSGWCAVVLGSIDTILSNTSRIHAWICEELGYESCACKGSVRIPALCDRQLMSCSEI